MQKNSNCSILKESLESIQTFLFDKLFLISSNKIQNHTIIIILEILELFSITYYFINPNLQFLVGNPLFGYYFQNIYPYLVIFYDSQNNQYLPLIVLAINFFIFGSICLLQFIKIRIVFLHIIQMYLLIMPVIFIEQIFAIINLNIYPFKTVVIMASSISLIIIIYGLKLNDKLVKLTEIPLIISIKFNMNPIIIMLVLSAETILTIYVYYRSQNKMNILKMRLYICFLFIEITLFLNCDKSFIDDSFSILLIAVTIFSILFSTKDFTISQQSLLEILKQLNYQDGEEKLITIIKYFQNHSENCYNSQCKCTQVLQFPINEQEINLEQFKTKVLEALSFIFIHRQNSSKNIIKFAQFCISHLKFNLIGLAYVLSELDCNFIVYRYKRYQISKKYEIYLKEASLQQQKFAILNNQFNQNIYEILSNFRQKIRNSLTFAKNFWVNLKKKQEDVLKKVFELSSIIIEIEQQYQSLNQKYEENIQLKNLYKAFELYVMKKQQNKQDDFDYLYCIPPLIITSYDKILRINRELTQFLGWKQSQLLNQSIDLILPEVFQNNHTNYLKQFIGNYDFKGSQNVKTPLTKAGYMQAVKFKMSLLPRFQNGVQIISFLQPYESLPRKDREYQTFFFLIDIETEKILGCSLEFFQYYKIKISENLYKKFLGQINLLDLIPRFDEREEIILEQMKLNPLNRAQTSIKLQAIKHLFHLNEDQLDKQQVEFEFINCFSKPQYLNLRLMKFIVQKLEPKSNKNQVNYKNFENETLIKPQKPQSKNLQFRIPYVILISSILIQIFFIEIISTFQNLVSSISLLYNFLTFYLMYSIQILDYQISGKSPNLNINWLQYLWIQGYGIGGEIFSVLDNLGENNAISQAFDWNYFYNNITGNLITSDMKLIDSVKDTHFREIRVYELVVILVFIVSGIYIIVDCIINFVYICNIQTKTEKIINLFNLIELDEINTIIFQISRFEQIIGNDIQEQKNQDDQQNSQINFYQEDSITGIIDTRYRFKSKAKISKISVDSFNALISVIHPDHLGQQQSKPKKQLKLELQTPIQIISNNQTELQNISLPSSVPFISKINVIKKQVKAEKVNQIKHKINTITKPLVMISINSFFLIGYLCAYFYILCIFTKELNKIIQFQTQINYQYPLYQLQVLKTLLKRPNNSQNQIATYLQDIQKSLDKIQIGFSNFKNNYQTLSTSNICLIYFLNDPICQTIQNGVMKLGQNTIALQLGQLLRQISSNNHTFNELNMSVQYIDLMQIMDYQNQITNNTNQLLLNQINSTIGTIYVYNYLLFGIYFAVIIIFILINLKILNFYKIKISQAIKILQIIPVKILYTNEKLKKYRQQQKI